MPKGNVVNEMMILNFIISFKTVSVHMVSSTVAGVALGLLIIILYLSTTHIHIFLLNNAVLIGAMIACCVLFSPLSKSYFWIIFLLFFCRFDLY